MRKYMIAGLGAVSAVAIAMGASAATATTTTSAPTVKEQVCGSVPGGIAGVQTQIDANAAQRALISTALGAAKTDFTAKSADLIDALVAHVGVVDSGGNVASSTALVTAQVQTYADAAAVWSGAWVDRDNAELADEVLGMQKAILTNLNTGLVCPAPTTTTTSTVPASTTTTAPVATTTTIDESTTTTIDETTTTLDESTTTSTP